MVDRVQVIKWETIGGGGSEEDQFPSEINPNEDGVEARSVFLQNDTSSDETVEVSRDASNNMTFKDGVVSGTKTLSDLLEGEDDDQVKVIVPTGETFTVKVDHQHIVFQEFTVDGEYIVDGESVILAGPQEVQGFDAYDGTGGTPLSGWTDVPLTVEAKTSVCFEHVAGSAEVKIKRTGTYLFLPRAGVGAVSDSDRSASSMRVLKNGSPLSGNRGDMYNRNSAEGKDSSMVGRLLDFVEGDILKVQVQRESGTNSLELTAEASGLVLLKVA